MTELRSFISVAVCTLAVGAAACSSPAPDAAAPATPTPAAAAPAAQGGTPAGTESPVPHACTLLTETDARFVFGEGARLNRNSDSECSIEPAKFGDGVVSIKIEPAPEDWEGSKKFMMQMTGSSTSVSGIADDAFTFMGGMILKKGTHRIHVIASAYHGQKPRDEVVRYLAEKVTAKM